jgi:hypothetical protein
MRALGPFVWVIMLLLPPALRGQQPITFDTVRFNTVGRFAVGHSVDETSNGYRTFSNQKGLDTLSQDIFVTEFGPDGALLSERTFRTYQQDWFGYSSTMQKVANGYYAGVGRFGVLGPLDSLFLYRFKNDGDTAWSKFIAVDTTLTMRGTAIESDGDVLLAGLHQYPEEAYIYHLDSVGNIKGFHGYPGFDGEDVVVGTDGSWFTCGMGNQGINNGRPVVLRSDTVGQQLWRHTDLSMYGTFRSLIALADGGVAAMGARNPLDSCQRCTISKLDSSGYLSWRKDPFRTNNPNWYCWFHAGYEGIDGALILAGWLRDTLVRDVGVLFKLDALGNTLWHRFYTHYPGASFGKDQIFWDVKPTSDGGMVLTGETNSDAFPYAQLWLLKLDSAGCLVPGCGSVGVEEYVDDLNKHLRVWPNPASEVLNLSLTLPEGAHVQGNVRALLLDGAGRVVQEEVVRQDLNHLNANLNVSTLAAGTYYLHLRDGKRWLAGSAVVVTPP